VWNGVEIIGVVWCGVQCGVAGWSELGWYAVGLGFGGVGEVWRNVVWWGGAEWSGGGVCGFMVGPCGWGSVQATEAARNAEFSVSMHTL
jgi:hypothetical protein